MPKMRGETDQEWMKRLQHVRATQMDRTRAAVAYLNTTSRGGDSPQAIHAFMDIFHPEVPLDRVRELAHSKR